MCPAGAITGFAHMVEICMSQIMGHVGDLRELMAWLHQHPGLPRLVARLYVFMGLPTGTARRPRS